jgi:sialidase-1
LKTEKGALIAFSEARKPGCDDFDRTDLVYKRSVDNGRTWSPLKALIEVNGNETGECNHQLVIGNISPLQLTNNSKYPGRIIAPYTRNNFKLWITHSDDDGLTWTNNK